MSICLDTHGHNVPISQYDQRLSKEAAEKKILGSTGEIKSKEIPQSGSTLKYNKSSAHNQTVLINLEPEIIFDKNNLNGGKL